MKASIALKWLSAVGLLLLLLLLAIVTAKPTLTALDSASGPPHALVMVQGTNLYRTRILWDAGKPSERVIPGGFLGGYMFSVPHDATNGPHPVALKNSSGTSNTLTFTVRDRTLYPFGSPRIDYVMLAGSSFVGGKVTPALYVQGANFDVGAVVLVNGVEVATFAHKGLRNDLHGVDPKDLGNPIYHFVSLVAVPDAQPAGSTLTLTVRNLDGKTSDACTTGDACTYRLPSDASLVDSDGDGLLDSWETGGFDADGDGKVDVDLHALGTDPYRRDVLVELDIMNGLHTPVVPTTPAGPGTIDTARAVFAAAPILNPMGDPGINLIVDASGSVEQVGLVIFDDGTSTGIATDPALVVAKFSDLKHDNFDNATRDKIFHYAIWATDLEGGSGKSDFSPDAALIWAGDDFVIGLDSMVTSDDPWPGYQTLRSQVEILVHELGHDLGQLHGGDDPYPYRPTFWSVMSYTWVLRTGKGPSSRRGHPTCQPFYYVTGSMEGADGTLPSNPDGFVDYSDGMAKPLRENSLNEEKGVCGQAVDWNGDMDTMDKGVTADLNFDGVLGKVADFANWRTLVFTGPARNGSLTP